jgi:hypothetical protein
MSEQTPSAAGLVTEPATTTTKAVKTPPFTDADPDPAHVLDPAKAGGSVSSPHKAVKRKRVRKPPAKKPAKAAAPEIPSPAPAPPSAEEIEAAATAAAEREAAAVAAYEATKEHEVGSFAVMPEEGALHLRLATGTTFIDGVIDVSREDLVPANQSNFVTYAKAVNIGPDCGHVTVTEAWLVAESGEAVKCALGPLSGGNGHHAQIPAGHLLF